MFKIKHLMFLSIGLFSVYTLVHGDQDDDEQETFESVSIKPSNDLLQRVNTLYKKNVKQIFSKKCLPCHGINNSKPWYYVIPGPKQLMDHDMNEAKRHMDMSNDFPFSGHGRSQDNLDSLKRTIDKGDMPPFIYKVIHWDSGLTSNEIEIIQKWISESKAILNSNKP